MFVPLKEASEYLQLPLSLLQQWVEQKRVKGIFNGDEYLIRLDHLEMYKEQWESWKEQREQGEPVPLESWRENYDIQDED